MGVVCWAPPRACFLPLCALELLLCRGPSRGAPSAHNHNQTMVPQLPPAHVSLNKGFLWVTASTQGGRLSQGHMLGTEAEEQPQAHRPTGYASTCWEISCLCQLPSVPTPPLTCLAILCNTVLAALARVGSRPRWTGMGAAKTPPWESMSRQNDWNDNGELPKVVGVHGYAWG